MGAITHSTSRQDAPRSATSFCQRYCASRGRRGENGSRYVGVRVSNKGIPSVDVALAIHYLARTSGR